MNRSYAIITESSSDLTPALAQEAGVDVLPLTFTLGDKVYPHYPDAREFPVGEFYRLLREGEMPTTAAANVAELTDIMEKHLKEGRDVLFLNFSSALSSTCASCAVAAEELREKYPERTIVTFDTKCASMGQALLVFLVAQKANAGAAIQEAAEYAREIRPHLAHWFTVDDLNHLKRGGRVSAAAAVMGTMLNIKPVLHVDDEGRLIPVSKVRGRKASLAALLQKMEETGTDLSGQTVFLSHGDCEEEALALRDQIREHFHPARIEVGPIGPIIGTHSGPGTMALFFLADRR